jgi:hypothetical protein
MGRSTDWLKCDSTSPIPVERAVNGSDETRKTKSASAQGLRTSLIPWADAGNSRFPVSLWKMEVAGYWLK